MKKYGLALEGGGTKGAYHVGVWKALRELKIEIGGVSGTSIGALVGALIVQDDYEIAYRLWYDISSELIFNGDADLYDKLSKFDFDTKDINKILTSFKKYIKDGGLDVSPLKELIDEKIDEEAIRKSDMDYGLVTLSIEEFKGLELYKEDIPEGKFKEYLLASANIPFFNIDKLDGKRLIDGGFYDNLPISLMVNKGYKNVIAVESKGVGFRKKGNYKGVNIIYITPSESTGATFEFSKTTARNNLKMGYFDCMRHFKNLEGTNYYLKDNLEEEYYIRYIYELKNKDTSIIKKNLGIEEKDSTRQVFEEIIPRYFDMLKLKDSDGYKHLYLGIYEEIAKICGVDRYKIFTTKKFITAVDKAFIDYAGEATNVLTINNFHVPKALKYMNMYIEKNREALIIELYKAITDRK